MAADTSLTSVQFQTLAALLNILVPRSADGRMPGAGELPAVVRQVAEVHAGVPALREALDALQSGATDRHGVAFASLDEPARGLLVDEMRERDPVLLQRLALETVTCYYQQDRVIEALGLEARPPYPKGYQVDAGDLNLLQPVVARGRIWRDAA